MQANRIDCIDALEGIADLPDESIPLTVTSPPYGTGHEYGEYDDTTLRGEWRGFMQDVLESLWRVTVPGGRVAVNVGFRPTSEGGGFRFIPLGSLLKADALEQGWEVVGDYVWDKGNVSAKPMGTYPYPPDVYPAYNHETISVFRKPGSRDVDREQQEESKYSTELWSRAANSVWRISTESMEDHPVDHTAIFPEEVPSRLVSLFSLEGDVVLDPFVGTGTTATVAAENGRDYIGFDVDEEYVEYARKRVESDKQAPLANSALEW